MSCYVHLYEGETKYTTCIKKADPKKERKEIIECIPKYANNAMIIKYKHLGFFIEPNILTPHPTPTSELLKKIRNEN